MRTVLRSLALVVLASGVALVVATARTRADGAQGDTKPSFDVADCKTCHEAQFSASFLKSHHAGAEDSCASCHKGAAEHAKAQMAGDTSTPAPSLKKMKPKEVNQTCQSCHEASHNATWAGSTHERRGVACTDCHSVHASKSPKSSLKTAHEPDTCYSCHPAMRAQALRTSHHPVREGLMTCTSCHNPHDGSRPKMIKADYTNELCFQCHTEKRGPYFWEHAPVRESCLNCHNPHGSNHDKMLVSQQPWLCQRCHLNTRHPGTLYSGVNTGTTVGLATNRAVEHACKNCHQNVHGGNAPTAPYFGR